METPLEALAREIKEASMERCYVCGKRRTCNDMRLCRECGQAERPAVLIGDNLWEMIALKRQFKNGKVAITCRRNGRYKVFHLTQAHLRTLADVIAAQQL